VAGVRRHRSMVTSSIEGEAEGMGIEDVEIVGAAVEIAGEEDAVDSPPIAASAEEAAAEVVSHPRTPTEAMRKVSQTDTTASA